MDRKFIERHYLRVRTRNFGRVIQPKASSARNPSTRRLRVIRQSSLMTVLAIAGLTMTTASAPSLLSPAAIAETTGSKLPPPPAGGVMGFVVHHFVPSVIQGKDACPEGLNISPRQRFLASLPPEERERIQLKENEAEYRQRYLASVTRPDGTNICSQYALSPDRPMVRTVQSRFAWGLNLDDDEGNGSNNPDGCPHENFVTPDGQKGIDNQAYRALGCKSTWRGTDGIAGDVVRGFNGFIASGEWSQVLLLRGVDNLANDDDVEVVYGNTPDRPVIDSAGKFVWNASYTISDKPPRERNLLRGKIVNGVLTTEPTLIKLTQIFGQSAARDTRAFRSKWTLHKGRLRLTFQADGSLKGLVAGYEPIAALITSTSLGGIGNLINGESDCAGEYNTLKKLADGIRDPKTGECTAVSSALELAAVPAFVNDIPMTDQQKIASH